MPRRQPEGLARLLAGGVLSERAQAEACAKESSYSIGLGAVAAEFED
jgi:hypothetical protein